MVKTKSGRAIARGLTTLAVAVAAAAAFTVTAAGPAQASSAKCQESLRQQHYTVGPKVRAACNAGQTGGAGILACYVSLLAIDVKPDHAAVACNAADD